MPVTGQTHGVSYTLPFFLKAQRTRVPQRFSLRGYSLSTSEYCCFVWQQLGVAKFRYTKQIPQSAILVLRHQASSVSTNQM